MTLYVASQLLIPKVSVYFVIESARKLLDALSYGMCEGVEWIYLSQDRDQ